MVCMFKGSQSFLRRREKLKNMSPWWNDLKILIVYIYILVKNTFLYRFCNKYIANVLFIRLKHLLLIVTETNIRKVLFIFINWTFVLKIYPGTLGRMHLKLSTNEYNATYNITCNKCINLCLHWKQEKNMENLLVPCFRYRPDFITLHVTLHSTITTLAFICNIMARY